MELAQIIFIIAAFLWVNECTASKKQLTGGVSAKVINAVYWKMGFKGPVPVTEPIDPTNQGVMAWKRRFSKEANGILPTFEDILITREFQNMKTVTKLSMRIIVFGAVGESGGPLFATLLKMVTSGKYVAQCMTVYWLRNYYNPDCDDLAACEFYLKLLAMAGVTVTEFAAGSKLDKSILRQAHFLWTGITGTEFRTYSPDKIQVVMEALHELKSVARQTDKTYSVIAYGVPSGMSDDGTWEITYPVDIILVPSFPKACLQSPTLPPMPDVFAKTSDIKAWFTERQQQVTHHLSLINYTEIYIIFYEDNTFFETMESMIETSEIAKPFGAFEALRKKEKEFVTLITSDASTKNTEVHVANWKKDFAEAMSFTVMDNDSLQFLNTAKLKAERNVYMKWK